jgi:hypothetical protein
MNVAISMRSDRARRAPRTVAFAVPNRINFILGSIAAALVVVYIGLMITTIFFASWQTQLARGIDDTRSRIQALETRYYDEIAKLDSTDPGSVGLVAPKKVEYVVAARMPGLTFAGN